MEKPAIYVIIGICMGILVNINLTLIYVFVFIFAASFIWLICNFLKLYTIKPTIICVIVGFIVGFIYLEYYDFKYGVHNLLDKNMTVDAIVVDYPIVFGDNKRVDILVNKTDDYNSFKTYIYVDKNIDINMQDSINFNANFYTPNKDRLSYYRSQGIFLITSQVNDLSINSADKNYLWAYPKILANYVKNSINHMFLGDKAGLMNAVLLSDKSGISDELNIYMQKAGTLHIAAVSGMHISFLTAIFIFMFGRRYGSFIAVIAVLLFIPMAGGSPSVMRAGIMYLIYVLSIIVDRESDTVNSIFLALAIILFINPYQIEGLSLQLSFLSTIGIVLFSTKIYNYIFGCCKIKSKIWGLICSSLSCSISAMIFTAPILMFNFDYISIIAPISNLLTLWSVSIIFILGIFSILCYYLFPIFLPIFVYVLGALMDYFVFVNKSIANINNSVVYLESSAIFIFIPIAILFIFIISRNSMKNLRLAIFLILSVVVILYNDNGVYINILSVGRGQAILIHNGEKLIVVDCSSSSYYGASVKIKNAMTWLGYDKIDTFISSSLDKSNSGDLIDLLHSSKIENIILPNSWNNTEFTDDIIYLINRLGINLTMPKSNMSLEIGDYIINIDSYINKKLVLNIDNIYLMSALTQNMILDYLSNNNIFIETLVISEKALDKDFKFREIISITSPKNIVVNSDKEIASKYYGIPINNTFIQDKINIRLE